MGNWLNPITPIDWPFCDDITQYILYFLSSHTVQLVNKNWHRLAHKNIKLRVHNLCALKNTNIVWGTETECAAIVSSISDNKQIYQLLNRSLHFGPFKTVAAGVEWRKKQSDCFKGQSYCLIPAYTTLLLFDGDHDIFRLHHSSWHIVNYTTKAFDNVFDGWEYAKIIGMTRDAVIFNDNNHEISLHAYTLCIYFQNITFDGCDENYEQFCKNGYLRLYSEQTIFVNCRFTARCGNTPIVCSRTEYNHCIYTPKVRMIGCVFNNVDKQTTRLYKPQKDTSVEIAYSEFAQYPVFQDY